MDLLIEKIVNEKEYMFNTYGGDILIKKNIMDVLTISIKNVWIYWIYLLEKCVHLYKELNYVINLLIEK